ncbi:hypothetical protein ACFQ2K_52405 [Streptomyces sanglieri]
MPMSQDTDEVLGIDMARMMASIPVSRLVSFSQGAVTLDDLEKLLAHLDAARAAADQA